MSESHVPCSVNRNVVLCFFKIGPRHVSLLWLLISSAQPPQPVAAVSFAEVLAFFQSKQQSLQEKVCAFGIFSVCKFQYVEKLVLWY